MVRHLVNRGGGGHGSRKSKLSSLRSRWGRSRAAHGDGGDGHHDTLGFGVGLGADHVDAALPSSQRSTLPQARAAASERLSLASDRPGVLLSGWCAVLVHADPAWAFAYGWTKLYRGTIVPKH